MDPHRVERIAGALREELAEMIEYELADERLREVTVTGVHVTPDLKRAHVSVSGGRESVEALEHARNYLRRELSSRLRLYRVPELHFETEDPSSPAARVEQLLERVRKNREKKAHPPEK
ncbi:MAG: 30S ribosome-binding factor RbfA [bacterium]|jgi:ribosome-binding factor A